ncbi:hypothetical protein ACIG54_36195 [Streptomyces achromogenes]|uniref:hypothetical protein n=1 Tax=Streptomyces achromogenes TaxID=67255 RepID=UPI0037D10365
MPPPRGAGESAAYPPQTTLAVDGAARVVTALQERLRGAQGPGPGAVRHATANRREANGGEARRRESPRAVAAGSGLVLVSGPGDPSRSSPLVEAARHTGVAVPHAEGGWCAGGPAPRAEEAEEIPRAALPGSRPVALTADTPAAPGPVEGVVGVLRALGPAGAAERLFAVGTVTFALPKELSR